MENARLNLILSTKLAAQVEEMACEASTSRTEIVRRALGLMIVAQRARKEGRYVGIADDVSKLDTLIIGLD